MDNLKISLKAARINANLTQKEVADTLQVSRSTLINWENGKISPSYATIFALSYIYNININNLTV